MSRDAAADAARAVSDADADLVLSQAPAHVTREQAAAALAAAAHDVSAAIAALWDVPPAPAAPRSDEQRAWDERRAQCDELARARNQLLAQRDGPRAAPRAASSGAAGTGVTVVEA